MRGLGLRKLIITGDDFGLALPVNEAIEQAHKKGVLTTASLMVGAAAAADAVNRARYLASLKVGLHIVLVRGRPILAAKDIPDLVDRNGQFSFHLVRAGFKFFFRPAVRWQLEAEIRAQFEAFRNTGLPLDHVNAHNHMHLHPTVLGLMLRVGRDYGLGAVRVPYEPLLHAWRASREGLFRRVVAEVVLGPWIAIMKRRLKRSKVQYNDYVFGMNDSGHMNADRLLRYLVHLPLGVSEIYCHPAVGRWPDMDPAMDHYHCQRELEALTNSAVKDVLRNSDIEQIAYGDLMPTNV